MTYVIVFRAHVKIASRIVSYIKALITVTVAGCCKKTLVIFVVADVTPDGFHFWLTLSPRTSEPVRHAPPPGAKFWRRYCVGYCDHFSTFCSLLTALIFFKCKYITHASIVQNHANCPWGYTQNIMINRNHPLGLHHYIV